LEELVAYTGAAHRLEPGEGGVEVAHEALGLGRRMPERDERLVHLNGVLAEVLLEAVHAEPDRVALVLPEPRRRRELGVRHVLERPEDRDVASEKGVERVRP